MKSDGFVRDLKELTPERVSRPRNENSVKFFNDYSQFHADRVSHGGAVNSAVSGCQPRPHAFLSDGLAVGITERTS